jgi:putative hydrolase of the HAD superfamily
VSIHAVTFDCWGTLLLDSPGTDERYKDRRLAGIEDVLRTVGIDVGRRRLSEAYEACGRHLSRAWTANCDLPVRIHVSALLEAVDPDLSHRVITPRVLPALIEAYASPALLAPPAVDPGARAAVEQLAARGLRLGVVSNTMRTPGAVLGQILDRAGLGFKVLTFSDECGIRKPDPRIFRQTLHRMGVAPEHAVHVGDDPILDVEGAREAGMAVIQVTPDGRATGPEKPDAVIRGLRELPAALERLTAARVA